MRRVILQLLSMTGFARESGSLRLDTTVFDWFWELKSVNGKSFDFKTKLPPSFENLTPELKVSAAEYFNRGSISAFLELKSTAGDQSLKINEKNLQELMSLSLKLHQQAADVWARPSITELLTVRGIVESEDTSLDEEAQNLLAQELLKTFKQTCAKMRQDRAQEGEKIKSALLLILDKISKTVDNLVKVAAAQPPKLKAKLQQQISELLGEDAGISEERLAQEVVLYVTRADVREELDRLQAHIKTAKELLTLGGTIGRRLDFLCQELNREANTTGSKSMDIEQTNLVVELKALVEQFREQVQNIE